MKWLMWQDTDPKKPTATKIREATARYLERFGTLPAETIEKAPGLFWLGPIEARRT
jgi:hypothetical protein